MNNAIPTSAARAFLVSLRLNRAFFTLVLSLLTISSAHSAVFDFSAPYTAVDVEVRGNLIIYRVFDPERGVFVVGSRSHGLGMANAPTNVINADGVVAWRSGNTIWYVIYDPQFGIWNEASQTEGTGGAIPTDLLNTRGIVAWRFNNTVRFVVYNPQRRTWDRGSQAHGNLSGGPPINLSNVDGTVAWLFNDAVWFAVYNPSRGSWDIESHENLSGGTMTTDFSNVGGIVAWRFGNTVSFAAYNPQRRAWNIDSQFHGNSIGGAIPTDFRNVGGVVAWRFGNAVWFTLYDPQQDAWAVASYNHGSGSSFTPSNLVVSISGTVTWTSRGQDFRRGYAPLEGTWYRGPTLPLAHFVPLASSTQAPALVWFVDMSLGGTAWSWDFGDGGTNNNRAPSHIFTNGGPFTVTQVVRGLGTNSTSAIITVDGPPIVLAVEPIDEQSTNEFAIMLEGQVGQRFNIEASPDLSTWTIVATVTNITGSFRYIAPRSASIGIRFYRASASP